MESPLSKAGLSPAEAYRAPSFSLRNRIIRALWGVAWFFLARWTPNKLNPWRLFLLRLFGASVANHSAIPRSAKIWYPPNLTVGDHAAVGPNTDIYCMAPIRIGDRAIISQRAVLCAGSHDIRDPNFQLTAKPIVVEKEAWVAAEAFVGPGVTIGEGAVLGARGCAFRDLEPWTIYAGNPAQPVGKRVLRSAARTQGEG